MPEPTSTPHAPSVVAIHVAPGRRLPMQARTAVVAEAGKGLVGDRYHGAKHRHVTIQSAPLLDRASEELGLPVPPEGTRRNLTVSHGDVPTTPGTRCRIGDAAALRRRAGTCFRVLVGGEIRMGDAVRFGPSRGDAW